MVREEVALPFFVPSFGRSKEAHLYCRAWGPEQNSEDPHN